MSKPRHSGASRNPVTDNLALWTSAVLTKSTTGRGSSGKQEAYGIKKLRELILELAVRGKLVPQDANDEPADSCLARARLKLLAEGKGARRSAWKETALVSDDEKTFDLPTGWAWARVNDTGFYVNGLAFKPTDWAVSGKPIIRIQNLTDPSKPLNYAQGEFPDEVTVRTGDLLVSWSATLDAFIWNCREGVLNQHIFKVITCHELVTQRFLYWLLKVAIKEMEESDHAHGLVMTHINRQPFLAHVVAIPPLAEQHRIVAKVDELMALCDQLEQRQTHSLEAHQTLVETLLGTLTRVTSQRELTEAWTRIANHFDTLFTTEHSVDQLKQTILQLAVRGKLVPQDVSEKSTSRPAEMLASNGAQSRSNGHPGWEGVSGEIREAEIPFKLPAGWVWLRFGELGEIVGGGTPSKANPHYWGGSIPWVCPKDMKVDFIAGSIDSISAKAIEETAVKVVPAGSLLVVVRGMILAHSFPAAITSVPVTINQDMKAVVFGGFDQKYVLLMVKAFKDDFLALVDRSTHGTCKLVSMKLWAKVLPVPPFAEQRRIVAQVDKLLELCDALKARLSEAQTTQVRLADAVVAGVIA